MDWPERDVEGWLRLTAAARRLEATAANVPVLGGRGGAPPPLPPGEGVVELRDAAADAEEGVRWVEAEARVAESVLRIAREHQRADRQQRMAALGADGSGDSGEEEVRERLLLEELEADTRRAEELEEALFRRSELRSRRVGIAAHLRVLPLHYARLFPAADADGATQEHQSQALLLREELQRRDQKVSAFLQLHAELLQVERELQVAKRARSKEEEATRRLWRQAAQGDEEGRRLHHSRTDSRKGTVGALREAEAENACLREVWQALILESGQNWAADDQLRKVLFSLQAPLAFHADR